MSSSAFVLTVDAANVALKLSWGVGAETVAGTYSMVDLGWLTASTTSATRRLASKTMMLKY